MFISERLDDLITSPLYSFGRESTLPITIIAMTKTNLLPTVRASKSFTGKNGRNWTKFLMSDNTEHIEQGLMQSPFMVTKAKGKDGKQHLSVWSVAS